MGLIFLQVEMDEATGLPTDQLTDVAVAECCRVGSSALTVSDILGNGGDNRVLRMIQKGIDAVNKTALSRAQKVQVCFQTFSVQNNYVLCKQSVLNSHKTFTKELSFLLIDCQVVHFGERFFNSNRRTQ